MGKLTKFQRAMMLELGLCGEAAAMAEGVHVAGARRGMAGRLEERGLVRIKVVGTLEKWSAGVVLTDAGRGYLELETPKGGDANRRQS